VPGFPDVTRPGPHNHGSEEENVVTRFDTTNWSFILRAAPGTTRRLRLAIALLCEAYWHPVYASRPPPGILRGRREDLTQGYFARFLEKVRPRGPPEHGRFRAFLLVSVRNFLHYARDLARALQRGGGRRLVSLVAEEAERTYDARLADRTTPEDLYEAAWARTLFDRVLEQLEQKAARQGKAERVARLRPFLTESERETGYAEVAAEWGVGESAVRAAVHRLRKEFGVFRGEVGRTVTDEKDVDDEIRHILSVLARPPISP
jgi:RNA polymerase sigma-70 factor (ECF subfamily)